MEVSVRSVLVNALNVKLITRNCISSSGEFPLRYLWPGGCLYRSKNCLVCYMWSQLVCVLFVGFTFTSDVFLSVGRLFETFVWDHRRCAPMMLCLFAARFARRPERLFTFCKSREGFCWLTAGWECVVCVLAELPLKDLEQSNPLPCLRTRIKKHKQKRGLIHLLVAATLSSFLQQGST